MKENEEIRKAKEELECLTGDEEARRLAELREKAIRDEVTNINDTKREIARKLKEEKVDVEIIMKSTGLTKEEIERL